MRKKSMSIADPPHDDKGVNPAVKGQGRGEEEEEGPVTLVITRRAKAEKTQEFERWLDDIIHEAMKFEGNMGVNVIRPPPNIPNPEYIIILRFDNFENLEKWEKSEIRKRWIERGKNLIEGKAKMEKQTGLEFWFTPGSGNVSNVIAEQPPLPPPRYKMAIVVIGIIFVLVSVLLPQVQQATAGLPVLLSTFLGVAIMVLLMTYVIMPSVTKLLRPWLLKKQLF